MPVLLHDWVPRGLDTFQYATKFVCYSIFLFSILVLTYCLNSIRTHGTGRHSTRSFPWKLTQPTLPILGHAVSLVFDAERFLRSLQSSFEGVVVVPLSLPGRCLNIALPGKGVRTMFSNSRDYVPVPGLFHALTIFFGLTPLDYAVFDHDHIAGFEERHSGGHVTSHPDPSRRIIEHQRRDFTLFLNGENLRLVIDRFSRNLRGEIERQLLRGQRESSTPVPCLDLYKFVRDAVFRAEVEALYGEHIFSICPSFCDDFWAFYDAFPVISRGLPRWLFPSHYQKRDRMLANFSTWRTWCNSNFDWPDEELANCEYEPVWGTRYVRRMIQRHEKLGFSDPGIASVMLGYLFVTTANTIPATAWMVLHAFLDESLTHRLRCELSVDKQLEDGIGDSVDLNQLGNAPHFNSVYREVMRLHVAGAIGRASVGTGFGSHRADDTATMTANWLAGLDAQFWNQGDTVGGKPEHPVDDFWAERFLEYPDDPASGPVRKPGCYKPAEDAFLQRRRGPKTARDDAGAKLVKAGLRGHWFPFGGGAWRCPGETLAKNTILTSAFLLLRDYQVEILDRSDAMEIASTHRHRTLPFGTHAFARPVHVRVRRRLG